ncbi:hypothetical protein TOPH_08640 [Tolypocladium ophioglossoides CBS 100239]|uniref:Thymidylate kinase n=1 Tax=Tolypocladium ophioglossoides (strain CBS 100239) TaxID=1163406 RepID=A0A0L0MXR9_TOLOC|nr:hypothetical protein TOPH_08640 [Tolypocladium ophioglossoides CBS 100239]
MKRAGGRPLPRPASPATAAAALAGGCVASLRVDWPGDRTPLAVGRVAPPRCGGLGQPARQWRIRSSSDLESSGLDASRYEGHPCRRSLVLCSCPALGPTIAPPPGEAALARVSLVLRPFAGARPWLRAPVLLLPWRAAPTRAVRLFPLPSRVVEPETVRNNNNNNTASALGSNTSSSEQQTLNRRARVEPLRALHPSPAALPPTLQRSSTLTNNNSPPFTPPCARGAISIVQRPLHSKLASPTTWAPAWTTTSTMAAVTRQPFAPLDGARLQSLTSLKNRQNATSPAGASGKRKAELLDTDDFENVDPQLFAKRSKGANASSTPSKDLLKRPSSFLLTKPSTPVTDLRQALASPVKQSASAPRRLLQPKSPVARLNAAIAKSSPISAPAGRSPPRGKRSGILSNRRRTVGPYARVDPPSFSLDSSAPFSLDAALKGTIPSYGARPKDAPKTSSVPDLGEPDMKASWFFDIHEDTPEQEMTNLLQHSTCVLDISSDEESEQKAKRERAEGRDKENIPPADDVSQTSHRRAARLSADDMVVERDRVALGEMNTADYYPDGCDESSLVLVPADEEEEQQTEPVAKPAPIVDEFAFAPERKDADEAGLDAVRDVDVLMTSKSQGSSKAAVLQPMEGTGQSFDLWESGSAKDESEPVAETMLAAAEL